MLGEYSRFFSAAFSHECVEAADRCLCIDDFSYEAVFAFLFSMYSGELKVTPGPLMEVFVLADKYCVDEITMLCEQRLRDLLRDSAESLSNVGEDAGPALPALIKLLDDKCSGVRKSAEQVLGRLGQHAAAAIPALTERLQDPKLSTRKVAAAVLGELGEHAVEALPDLIALLDDEDSGVRKSAEQVLVIWSDGSLEEHAMPAVPALIKCQVRTARMFFATSSFPLLEVSCCRSARAIVAQILQISDV